MQYSLPLGVALQDPTPLASDDWRGLMARARSQQLLSEKSQAQSRMARLAANLQKDIQGT